MYCKSSFTQKQNSRTDANEVLHKNKTQGQMLMTSMAATLNMVGFIECFCFFYDPDNPIL